MDIIYGLLTYYLVMGMICASVVTVLCVRALCLHAHLRHEVRQGPLSYLVRDLACILLTVAAWPYVIAEANREMSK